MLKINYRISAILASAVVSALAMTICTSCGAPAGDPWDASAQPKAEKLIQTDISAPIFTGKEWTGKTISKDIAGNLVSQSDIVRVNALPYHTVGTVVYDSVEKALEGAKNYNRSVSDYYKLITGEDDIWQLAVYKNEDDASAAGVLDNFYKTDYDMSTAPAYEGEDKIYSYSDAYYGGFKDVTLPRSWQTQGFDFPIYTNYTYPWNDGAYGNEKLMAPTAPTVTNPVGFYRYEFDVDSDWMAQNRRVYISFGGVESAYYVYVNGHEVGYSEDSFDAADFDITPYLNADGKGNLLAVKVYRWCDGSYYENQDFLRLAGIFRDVYLYSTPGVRISDYTVVTDLDDSYKNAELKLDVEVSNTTVSEASGYAIDVKLFDADGKNIFESSPVRKSVSKTASGEAAQVELSKKVKSPRLWSDEDPYLYTLVISLYDSDGAYYGSLSQQLGFREITFTSTEGTSENAHYDTVLLNGKEILLKGVNRHENNPETGRYLSADMEEKDIQIMKSLNINAVRTSHYPDCEDFYNMCDKYGILVLGECNVETHYNVSGADTDTYFMNIVKDRIYAHTIAYKNRTSIIIWSMGNETIGGTKAFLDSIQELKQRDSTRPIHFESQGSGGGVDISSTMYSSVDDVKSRGTWENHMPYLICEYAHAMGNSVGNLYEYWEPMREYDNLLGGFIWDFVDQSIWTEIPAGKYDYYGNGKYLAYGGCWGDNPNSGDFCQNGIISADRQIQPEANEVKYVYQSVWFTADKLSADNKQVSIYNEFKTTDLSAYDFKYELTRNGTVIDSGNFEVSCAPKETVSVAIPYNLPESHQPDSEYHLNLYACLKQDTLWEKAGYVIALEQFEIECDSTETEPDISVMGLVNLSETDSDITVTGDNFSAVFSKKKCELTGYTVGGETIIEKGLTPTFTRAKLSNDNIWGGMENATVKSVSDLTCETIEDGKAVKISAKLELSVSGASEEIVYTIYGDGQIKVERSLTLPRDIAEILKYGNTLTLPADYEYITYYGRGEADTYCDRKRGAPVGLYSQTVSDSFYPYGNPQDTGNKTDVRYIALTSDERNTGILVSCDDKLEASALHYTASQIQNARYTYSLPEVKNTILNIDCGSRGTGGASCGPEPLSQYKMSHTGYKYSYTIIPFDKSGTDIDSLAQQWRTDK